MNKETRGIIQKVIPYSFNIALYFFIIICPIFILGNWNLDMIQDIFFCFGIFALLGLSFICPKQREYYNPYLGIFVLYSILNLLIHTFNYSLTSSISSSFINYCLMSEGFIYILCGSILIYLIVSYSKEFKVRYPLLILNIINIIFCISQLLGYHFIWNNKQEIFGVMGTKTHLGIFSALSIPVLYSINPILFIIPAVNLFLSNSWGSMMGFVIASAIFFKKKSLPIVIPGVIIIIVLFHNLIKFKILVRVNSFIYTIKEIITHPFVGWGFDNSLTFNMIPIKNEGMVYRNFDLLNITRDLGIPFFIIIILLLKRIFNWQRDYLLYSFIILLTCSCFQTSMYFIRIAVFGIFLFSLLEIENGKIGARI